MVTAIDQLLHEIAAGKKYMKVYKQMKMYNDEALNPILYQAKNRDEKHHLIVLRFSAFK